MGRTAAVVERPGLSGARLAGVEKQLSGEAGGPANMSCQSPDVGDKSQGADDDGTADPLTSLRNDLAAAGGRTKLAPTMKGGYDGGPGVAPDRDYKSERCRREDLRLLAGPFAHAVDALQTGEKGNRRTAITRAANQQRFCGGSHSAASWSTFS